MGDAPPSGGDDPQITFKVKTSSDGMHTITIAETVTVLDLKNKLAGPDYENVPADRQRLIYSGRVMKNEEPLTTYKIKAGNTIHMVKSAASNAAQSAASTTTSTSPGSTPSAAAGVPTNMAAGTANNPLAGLTGARYAGHVNLPNMDMFGADGGMGAPQTGEQMADMLSDPAMAQMMNEALNNPQMIDLMIQSNPTLRQMGPAAREMLQSPMFRQMMTNPDMLRQAARMQRQMGGGAAAFPAPGVTNTTPEGAAGTTPSNNPAANPFGTLGAGNPFALFGNQGFGGATGTPPARSTPATGTTGTTGQAAPSTGAVDPNNPLAGLFGAGAGGMPPFLPQGMPPPTPEQLQQALNLMGMGNMFGPGGAGGGFGAGTGSPPPPADTRPPEEQYAEQLRQLNDMGFFDFDQNIQALRRSGGSVTGAVNQLLGG